MCVCCRKSAKRLFDGGKSHCAARDGDAAVGDMRGLRFHQSQDGGAVVRYASDLTAQETDANLKLVDAVLTEAFAGALFPHPHSANTLHSTYKATLRVGYGHATGW